MFMPCERKVVCKGMLVRKRRLRLDLYPRQSRMGEILDANHMFDTNNDRRQHGYFHFEIKAGCHAGRGVYYP